MVTDKGIMALLRQGYEVRCLSRRPSDLHLPPSVEKVQADVFDLPQLEEALRGVDVAYYFIHSMEKAPPEKGTFVERDENAAVSFCEAAANARIKRIVYLGGLGETHDDLSPHLASRMKVGEILQSGRVPATVFRAAIVVGPEGTSFKMSSGKCSKRHQQSSSD